MRVLEWLFALSFIPTLLIPFIPAHWRVRWLRVATLLLAVAMIVHLVGEGWRVQLLPLYALAILIVISRLPEALGRRSIIQSRRGVILSALGALMVGGSVVVAGWLLPVVTLAPPTGPHAVGVVDRLVIDDARGRKLMLSVWYPAAQTGTPAPLTHHPTEVAQALANLPGLPGVLLQQMRYFTVAASEDVPILASDAPFPILVFSHGLVGLRLQNSPTLQELASWGYVIVALDHTDAAAVTVFPDGEVRPYNLANFGILPAMGVPDKAMMEEYVFPVWVADQRFIYDTLTAWAVDDPLLAGKLDLDRIASFGHSFGGATAQELCRVEARCRAAVNLDGGLYGASVTEAATKPLILMSSEESGALPDAVAKWAAMIDQAQAPARWLELPGSNHYSFTILPLFSPLLAPAGFDAHQGLATVDKYLRAFFDLHLRGVTTFPLGPDAATTDVHWRTE